MKTRFCFRLLVLAAGILASTLSTQAQTPESRSMSIRPEPDRNGHRDGNHDLSVSVWTSRSSYEIGENARIYFRANRDAYVYVYATDARGVTTQLFPNHYDRDNKVDGGITHRLPRSGYRLRVTPPTGRETITVYAFSANRHGIHHRRHYSGSNPFPQTSSPQAEMRAILPEGKRDRDYATDSTTVRVIHRDRRH